MNSRYGPEASSTQLDRHDVSVQGLSASTSTPPDVEHVFTVDGFAYEVRERAAITEWLRDGDSSPRHGRRSGESKRAIPSLTFLTPMQTDHIPIP